MKRVLLATALVLASTTAVVAHDKSHGDHSKKASKDETLTTERVVVDVRFSHHDQRVIREYYAPRYRSLPPGLQKKVARGGELPPGWQKKLQPFPSALERQLAPLPANYGRGVIDGHAVIYKTRSQTVIDVAVLR
jgi:hypothetical protein